MKRLESLLKPVQKFVISVLLLSLSYISPVFAASGISIAPPAGTLLTEIDNNGKSSDLFDQVLFNYSATKSYFLAVDTNSETKKYKLDVFVTSRHQIDSPVLSNLLVIHSDNDGSVPQLFVLGPIDIESIRQIGSSRIAIEGSGGNEYGNFDHFSHEHCNFSGIKRKIIIELQLGRNQYKLQMRYIKISDSKYCDTQE